MMFSTSAMQNQKDFMMNIRYYLIAACMVTNGLFFSVAQAGQPTNITYSGKNTTFTGDKYRYYSVRCSDGKVRHVTSWSARKKRKWCVGKGKDNSCSNSQLTSAKRACR
ncbi:hypothetical protein [Candidatus Venteria ishoeyi]|uniref:Uncharacterized protein n=1 Tax=Candidatus Venteria ishoeyi TaxID=1899563 RepID=A0A1H6FGY8_9GAMM|nr:hypothetical protein [Candidatus Venteria ishoeyi]MDM8545836.1 hypothetical protein [Candidatus Venteria ishoeyi]SEH08295.1 Uncharacterised protein [Candidatus Venteria ishoeyi]